MSSIGGSKLFYSVLLVSLLLLLANAVTNPIRPLFIVDTGASPVQLGLIMALPSIVSMVARVPISSILRRFGSWKIVFLSLLLSMVAYSLFAFIYDPVWFFPVVPLSTFCWVVFGPLAVTVATNQATPSTRGIIMGVYYTSIGAAMFIGPLLSSILTIFIDIRRLHLVSAIFPVIALAIFLLFIKPREFEENITVQDSSDRTRGKPLDGLKRILKVRNVFTLLYARIGFAITMTMFGTIFPIYANDKLGLTPSLISLLFTFRGFMNLFPRIPAGRLSDRIGRRKPFIIGYGMLIIALIFVVISQDYWILVLAMAVYGVGWGTRIAASTALLSESIDPVDRPMTIAIYLTMFDIGSTIGAILTGLTASFLSPQMIIFICVPIMASALLLFTILSEETLKKI